MTALLPYYFARHAASRLDADGKRPGAVFRVVVGIPLAIVLLGSAALVVFAMSDFALWELGVTG